MGDFKEHVIFGFLAAAVTSYLLSDFVNLNRVEVLVSSITIVIGAVLPDIDHKKAYVHRFAKIFTSVGAAIASIIYAPVPVHVGFAIASAVFLLVYTGFSALKLKHRGFTHSLVFLLVVSGVSAFATLSLAGSLIPGLAVGIGLFSHLLLDQHFSLF